ncbi:MULTISPECIES: phosphogluconate dehydrogenase C-terminal domain-containing protein [Propionibacterium]|jgi:hypothetical protein|uniref:phosphogluconate dehydrogenase C-terminal domain-containing protein n=1 Tax=Propionibacterium TaxID=1743 RepID=UPI0005A5C704|nr:phosphogluconate dehydrogenase C-terminal domain-containing protein [Propionibacterium freudenreichii]CEI49904.1 Protein of unknown function [Propionibacterium freudenreichii]SBN49693.1 Hypothetical protein PFR_JS8_121 [Propionibacterium freudenreichii]SBN59030.1 Hypothetical protein PFR_JS11_108 [Propionibacterium freudenreichii]SBN94489.1 Hypothetical protein PFR_JS12-2_105 [Propionibacterium freudenreichii]SBT28240.1 Hypothetical protein PFR_JS14_103 [Propionibacterium freudenreichii]
MPPDPASLSGTSGGSNPFSGASLLAMDYGREAIIKDEWKRAYDDKDPGIVIAKMLKLDKIER